MHSSRICTINCSDRLSCHACPHPLPHTPLLCHVCPLPCTHPCHAPLCHTPSLSCIPPFPTHPHTPFTMHTSFAMDALPLWTEFLTHAYENITFPQLLLQTVITFNEQKWENYYRKRRSISWSYFGLAKLVSISFSSNQLSLIFLCQK